MSFAHLACQTDDSDMEDIKSTMPRSPSIDSHASNCTDCEHIVQTTNNSMDLDESTVPSNEDVEMAGTEEELPSDPGEAKASELNVSF